MILVCSKCGKYFTAPSRPEDGLCTPCRAAQMSDTRTPSVSSGIEALDGRRLKPQLERADQESDAQTPRVSSDGESLDGRAGNRAQGGPDARSSRDAPDGERAGNRAQGRPDAQSPSASSDGEALDGCAGKLVSSDASEIRALYERAVSLERNWRLNRAKELCALYRQLGDYRDAPARLEAVQRRARNEYARDTGIVANHNSRFEVEAALRRLRELNGCGDSAEVIARGEVRLEALRERERLKEAAARRAKLRKRLLGLFLGCAALAAVAAGIFFYTQRTLPNYISDADQALTDGRYEEAIELYQLAGADEQATDATIARADAALEAGDYDEAIALYEQAGASERVTQVTIARADAALEAGDFDEAIALYEQAGASERVTEVILTQGDLALEAGDFGGAIEFYERAGASERATQATLAWGERLLADGDYEGAIEKFSAAGDAQAVNDAYFAWSDHVAKTQDAASAIAILANAADSPERAARMGELQLQRADEALALVRARDDMDSAYARELGEPLTLLDAQLRYCHGLAEAGFDLMRVYPDGVAVEDAPLAQYQIDDIINFNRDDWADSVPYSANLDTSKLLLFERVERPYDVSDGSLAPELTAADRHDDALFDVRLLPGELFSLDARLVADSWDDVTCIALLDNIYLPDGTITRETYTSSGDARSSQPSTKTNYRYYRGLSCFVAYDRHDPRTAVVLKGDFVDSPCADEAWFKENMNSSAVLAVENRLPKLDPSTLYADLATSLVLLLLM